MTNYAKWNSFDVSDSDEDDAVKPPPARPAAPSGSGRSSTRASDAATVLERMQRAELLGEEILTDRQQMVELDRRRNKNREALAALRRIDRQGPEAAASQKHWVCLGQTFAKHSQAETRGMLEADQTRLDAELDRLRGDVKRKTSLVCELDPSMCAAHPPAPTRPTLDAPDPLCRLLDTDGRRVPSPGLRRAGGSDIHRSFVDLRDG